MNCNWLWNVSVNVNGGWFSIHHMTIYTLSLTVQWNSLFFHQFPCNIYAEWRWWRNGITWQESDELKENAQTVYITSKKNVCQTFCSSAAQWQRIIFNCLCGFSLAWTDFGMTVSMHVINAYDIDIHWVQSSSDNEIERKNNDLATWHFALFWNVNTVHTLMALLKCWQTNANISIVSDYACAFKSDSYVVCVCVYRWDVYDDTKSH